VAQAHGGHQCTITDTDPRTFTEYVYNGKCEGCSSGAAVAPQVDYAKMVPVYRPVLDVEAGDEVGFAPRMLLSWVVTHLGEHHADLEWGDSHHNNDTLNFLLPLIDRVKLIRDLKVGTPARARLPTDDPGKTSPDRRTVVVTAKSPQSFGTMMKVKDRNMDKGFYMLSITFVVDVASGHVISVTATRCLCKSPYKFCRHVVVTMIACARLEADHYMTATSGDSYWKGSARTNASEEDVHARALSIAELTPSYVYLSDIKERPLTPKEVEEFLG
jgi:hypothetical protein